MTVGVVAVVPNGNRRPDALCHAIRAWHPNWLLRTVYVGDPQLRLPTNVERLVVAEPSELEVVATEPGTLAWRCAGRAALELLDSVDCVLIVQVGEVAVLAALDDLVDGEDDVVLLQGTQPDGSTRLFGGVLVVRSRAAAESLASLSIDIDDPFASFGDDVHWANEALLANPNRWDDGAVLLDCAGFDAEQPWVLDATGDVASAVQIRGHADRERAVRHAIPQVSGQRAPVRLPGGIVVDAAIRAAATPDTPQQPFSDPAGFRTWLDTHAWEELLDRPDLAEAFGDAGVQSPDYAGWTAWAAIADGAWLAIEPLPTRTPPIARPVWKPRPTRQRAGINIVGYLEHEVSLGDVARRLLDTSRAGGIDVAAVASRRTGSPPIHDAPALDAHIRYDTTVAVINADQFGFLRDDLPELWADQREVIGYWFWELDEIPVAMLQALHWVDRVWVGSNFVADAFRRVSAVPVEVVALPVARPVASDRLRADFDFLADTAGRFVFIVAFDHLSVTERKNPFGAIDAFTRAFAPDEGPLLLIKSMNAERAPADHERLLVAAAGRSDVRIVDRHLERSDQMALVAACDALVSLHRSEGLGLHLAEAMWLGVPVIATRYSGNLDFMDDDCAALVDAAMTPVRFGRGVYPSRAMWADPDLDQAARWMRTFVDEPDTARHLAAAARRRMESQPTAEQTGRRIAELLDIVGRA